MGIIENLISQFLTKGAITHKSALGRHAFHIRIQSESFKTAAYVPGYFLRLFCGKGRDVALKDKIRSYSVWNYDRNKGSIDLAVCLHSDGPGATWAKECTIGDGIHFSWHQGKFIVDSSADYYVFVGDLSALGHLYEIRRNLPVTKKVVSIIYGEDEADFFPDIDHTHPFDFYTMPVNPGLLLIDILQQALQGQNGSGMVYIGGDSRVCVTLNQYFKQERKWGVRQIKAKPFWNPEKKGLE
jgi:NADPH-dependent ferric siderophore reductase